MAFTVEDGTGLANANSLCSVADAVAYWTERGGPTGEAFTGATQAEQETALVRASDYVRNQSRYRWYGTKNSYAQRMPWPRTGASERDGTTVPDNVVPWQVKEAVSYLAGVGIDPTAVTLEPDLERGGRVTSERIDVLSFTYADDAPAGTVYSTVDGILAPLLRDKSARVIEPEYAEPTIADGFETDQFTNNA